MSRDKEKIEAMFKAVLETSKKLEHSYNLLKKKFTLLEIKLENNRRYLENILRSINTGVCSIDLDCRITTFNNEACSVFGVTENSVKNLKLKELFNLNIKNVFELIDKFKESKTVEIEVKNRIKKISLSASSITDNERIVGAVIIFSDITRLVELEEESRKKEKLAVIGQMAASIAHDIKNPLASIELLIPLLYDDESKKEIFDNVMISIKRINNIVNNTLLFTKTVIYKPERFNSNDFVKDIELELYAHIKAKNIEFVKDVESFYIVSDKNLLKNAVVNLAVNAFDAAKSRVELKVYKHKGKVVLEVADDGSGISKKDREHIFEPFYTNKKDGTGLGLSIVAKAVRIIDGSLEFKSSTRGTRFKITL